MEPKEFEILLVEDSEADIEMILRSLSNCNVCNPVKVARDGREALELLFSGEGGPERVKPRVVFLDLKLPKVPGQEVLRRIKSDEKTRDIPVVIMTSSSEQADIDRCYELGANSYVVKPIGFEDFSRVVKELKLYWLVINEPPPIKTSRTMPEELRILILEDNPADAELTQKELEKAGLSFIAKIAATRREFLLQLDSFDPDIILSDYALPGFDGISAMRLAVAGKPEVPFVFVTGEMGEERAIDTLKEGATDYVLKQRLARLGPAVTRALAEVQEKSQRRRAEENYRTVFETTGTAMCVLGEDSVVLSANRGFERLLGYAVGEPEPEVRFTQVVSRGGPEVEDFDRYHREVLSEGGTDPVFFETRVVHRDGRTLDVLASMGRLPGTRNSVLSLIDVTREKRYEAELRERAERLRDFLTVAAHELRHPATIFKGYSHILLENAENLDSEVARDALMSIDSASDRLARTVNQLMDASSIERGEMSLRFEEIEPRTLLNRVTAEFHGTGANIDTSDKTGEGAVFRADREKLRAVLANLVENAVKFSPDGTLVDVCVEAASGGLIFSVCDKGPGMSEEHAEHVFERFYQVEDVEHHSIPGIGLGLYIAKTIVDEHGGWIRCRPGERGGSVFEFFIPEHPLAEVYPETERERVKAELLPSWEPRPPYKTADDAGLDDNGRKKVLRVAVIDDDPDIVKVNMMMIESRGYEAIAAYGGEEGLEMVGRETPDVVLLDIMMPGLDGFETCRRLKSDERTRGIPVIFVTAKTSEECSEEALAAGGSGFLSKPFKAVELFECIEQVCNAERNGVLSAERTER